jgi:hypothetical protein
MRILFSCVAIGVFGASVAAQTVPTRTLTKPEIEVRHEFSWIEEGVRELRDGRVIVLGEADAPLQVIDFSSATVTGISRKGNGPGEYHIPNQLFALPGDSTAGDDGGCTTIPRAS